MQPTPHHNLAGESELRAKRRRRRRRGRNPLYSIRVAVMLLGGVGAAYLAFAFLSKVAHPYRLGYETRRQVRAARAELERQEAVNADLQRRIEYLNSDEGAESEARRLGYYREGETVYLLRTEEHEAEAVAPAAAAAPAPETTPAASRAGRTAAPSD